MKICALLLTAILGISLFAAGKMNISGQKNPEEVVEKEGIYTVAPQSKTRIQLYPRSGYQAIAANQEIEISADVYGSGNIQLGAHLYNDRRTWRGSIAGKMIRVDAEESETVKTVLTVNRENISQILPLISIYSGKVIVENLQVRLNGVLTSANKADAPKPANWHYNHANALKCSMDNGVLNIVTGTGQMTELLGAYHQAKAGDKFRFSGKISGKGKISIGLYLYSSRRVWLGTVWKVITVNKDALLPALTVDQPKGKEPVSFIRPVLRINAKSDISVSGLGAEAVK